MMDYDKLYYPKIEMSQTVPTTGNSQIQDPYAVYADSFDLSLLPSTSPFTTTATTTSIKSDDDEIPLNTIQSLSLSLSLSSSSSSSSSLPLSPITESSPESPLVSIDYIPATIYHDQSIKLEKPWNQKDPNTNTGHNNNSSSNNNNNNSNCEDKKHITISSNKITAAAISHHQTSSSSSSDTSILLQQFQKHYQFYPSPLPSPPQESSASSSITTSGGGGGGGGTISIYPPSPCPSIEQNQNFQNFHIKQEFHILPPSPPESNGAPSPAACCIDIKSEPETDTTETLLDISSLLESSITSSSSSSSSHSLSQLESSSISQQQKSQNHQVSKKPAQDHQLLREYLQDTSFQKKHNLKPLALESLFGGFGVRADIEPVISLALEHAKRDAQATCALLKISPDPQQWTTSQVHAWIRSTIEQFKLPSNNDIEMKFPENGSALMCLSEDEFNRRVPEAGSTIHAQLEIWKLACSENFSTDFGLPPTTTTILPPSTINGSLISNSTWNSHTNCSDTMSMDMDISGDEDEEMIPISATSSIHHHHDNTSNISVIPLGGTSPPSAPSAPSMVATATSPSTNNEINSTTSLLTPNTSQQITSTDCTTIDINGTTNTSTNAATILLSSSKKSSTIATMAATATPSTATATVAATTPAVTTTKSGTRPSSSHIHLWQFLKELLASPQLHGTAIRWLDRSKGVFKIEDSVRVAKLWGRRKNRPAMNYDKLSRSIRQYYKKGIMKKTERSQRLVYQFCHPYSL